MNVWLPVVGMLFATVLTALFAPGLARRAETKRQGRRELERRAARGDEVSVEYNQMLFTQLESMAAQHRQDIADLRTRLADSERARDSQGHRIGELERRLTEFESGMRVAIGYVLIPGALWSEIRTRLPDLPATRFPGERVAVEPGDTGGER